MNIAKIGKIIAAKRRELGYTQEDLGRALGVTDKAVSKWERGISYPDVALLGRIATLLRIDVKVLLHGEISEATDSSLAAQKKEGSTPRSAARSDGTVQLDFGTHAAQRVSPRLFGNNLEHTRSCLHTGLSAQMLKNRKFAGKPSAVSGHAVGWYPIGEKTHFAFSEPYTRHDTEHYHMKRALEMNAQRIHRLCRRAALRHRTARADGAGGQAI